MVLPFIILKAAGAKISFSISLVQRNIVVSPKIWKMGLLLPFDIKDKIFPTNVL